MTVLPNVTWPSPPMTTLPPRRTERMVVPLNTLTSQKLQKQVGDFTWYKFKMLGKIGAP